MSSSSGYVNYTSLEFTLTDVEIGILCTANVIFSIIGSFGNVLVCFAFLRFPRLRNTINIFILSLACSALLVCLIAQPMYVVSLIKHYQQEHITNVFEKVRKCFTWISLLASAGNLFGVTLDRYYAITKPFRRSEDNAARANAFIFVAIVWFIAAGLGTSAVFEETIKLVVLAYVFIIVLCLILPLYTRILVIAAKHRQRILAGQTYTSNMGMRDQMKPPTYFKYRSKLRQKIDRSALITVGVICAVFVLGWFPLLILPLVYRIIEEDRELILDVFQWVNTIALCSSACNPMVYAATDKRFRESLKVTYRRWVTRRQDLATIQSQRRSSRSSKRSHEKSNQSNESS
jgi:hypothetical protein